jgi:hypothetical protein
MSRTQNVRKGDLCSHLFLWCAHSVQVFDRDVVGIGGHELLPNDVLSSFDPIAIPPLLLEIFEFMFWMENFL